VSSAAISTGVLFGHRSASIAKVLGRPDLVHDRAMGEDEEPQGRSADANADTDRVVRILSLEYGTLREEMLVRSTERYQFVGFVTGATGLIGAGIGLSSYGVKTWILVGLAVVVIAVGLYGYFLMRFHSIALSARIAVLERRINDLVPAEPGFERVLSWEIDHQGVPVFFFPRFLIRRLPDYLAGSRPHPDTGATRSEAA
jgi:hypothetical protein